MNSMCPTKPGVMAITVPITEPQKHSSLLSELQLGLFYKVRRHVPSPVVRSMQSNSSLHVYGLDQKPALSHCTSTVHGTWSRLDPTQSPGNSPLPGSPESLSLLVGYPIPTIASQEAKCIAHYLVIQVTMYIY